MINRRDNLGCNAYRMDYDWITKKGRLFIASCECVEMAACVNLFRAIDPDVNYIETYAGGPLDTVYVRKGDSNFWHASLNDRYSKEQYVLPDQMSDEDVLEDLDDE